ncbi:MAG: hypothetical protein GY705_27405 [Bacteroidetes bacterium]|nr:hypothetical protein [Bacteroidota bacterium]
MEKIFSLLLSAFLAFTCFGCAFDIVHIDQVPVQYEKKNVQRSGFKLQDEVNVSLGTGYSRTLNKGTEWHYVSTISQGDIFKTNDQILTVEGSNIFEAFIVVSDKQLVGFFLPVEETYSPLSTAKSLPMVNINQ